METTSNQETTVTEDDIKKFENMVASMPDSANAHYNLGLALAQKGGMGQKPKRISHRIAT